MKRPSLEYVKTLALTAGELIQKLDEQNSSETKEGRGNYVTQADLESETYIIESIKRDFPDTNILAEETIADVKNPEQYQYLWVIDPVDGTNNLKFQRKYSAVSIGLMHYGEPLIGAVYNPFTSDLYLAEVGKGAWLNDKKIVVSDNNNEKNYSLATDNSYDPVLGKKIIQLLLNLDPLPWLLIKGSAALALCEVAAGKIDIYFHLCLKPWDSAAAIVILTEAGAKMESLDKDMKPSFTSPTLIVGNSKLVGQLLPQLTIN